MSDDKTDAAKQLREVPEVQPHDPDKPTFYLVSPAVMQAVIKQLGQLKASKVHGLLNTLNNCQSVTAEVKRNG